jgi:phosphodiesterase/alkaline phosphatase D-like protein
MAPVLLESPADASVKSDGQDTSLRRGQIYFYNFVFEKKTTVFGHIQLSTPSIFPRKNSQDFY